VLSSALQQAATGINTVIVLDLICEEEHRFEGWFASHEEFERQRTAALVSCPRCNSPSIRRLPSAPHITRSTSAPPAAPEPTEVLKHLLGALQKIASNSEDVGERFADEARKIHYGDAEARAIRGETTLGEGLRLLEEGISVLPLPTPKEDLH
jgi:hypothetical protein